jgi:hypothetical protein
MHHYYMKATPTRREWPKKVFSQLWEGVLCTILQTNFHEKAHFVKPT